MIFPKFPGKLLALGALSAGLALTIGLIPGPLARLHAQGITIFGNIDADLRLAYLIDRNAPYSSNARYYLRVEGDKVRRDIIELAFTLPDKFMEEGGEIRVEEIVVRQGRHRGDDEIPIRSVRETVGFDLAAQAQRSTIEIIPESPIPQDTDFVIVLQSVRNPRRYGYHYFNLELFFQGDVTRQYVGTWPLEVAAERSGDR